MLKRDLRAPYWGDKGEASTKTTGALVIGLSRETVELGLGVACMSRCTTSAAESSGQHRTDLLRDRHVDAPPARQAQDAGRRPRPPPPSASGRGSPGVADPCRAPRRRRLRLCGLLHVAIRSPFPARPRNVNGVPPTATPSRVSSARPRVMAALVFQPKPRPSPIRPQWRGRSSPRRRPRSRPRRGSLHVQRVGHQQLLKSLCRAMSRLAMTVADGSPAMTSRAILGPDNTHSTRIALQHLVEHLGHPTACACLDALGHGHEIDVARHERARSLDDGSEVLRRNRDENYLGVAQSRLEIARGPQEQSANPGRNTGFSRLRETASATSGSRAHSTASLRADTRDASVVPHEPAPSTVTFKRHGPSRRALAARGEPRGRRPIAGHEPPRRARGGSPW